MTEMTNREARRFEESQRAAERARSPAEPTTRIRPAEFERSTEIFHEAVRKTSMQSILKPTATLDIDALEATLREVMTLADRCRDLLKQPIAAASGLSSADRDRSLLEGILAIAKPLRGGWAFGSGKHGDSHQTLLERLITVSPDAEYWRGQAPGLLATMLKEHPFIGEKLESEGVLAWRCEDASVRIVNARWLTDPAEITAFVQSPPEPGRRCRFCRTVEPDGSKELRDLHSERKPTVAVQGWPYKRTVTPYGTVAIHDRCQPHWLKWVELAENHEPGPEAA